MQTRANIRQVAERAGVSKSTVSNVLLGRHAEVSPSTCEVVLKAARELDYVPVRPTLQNRHVETRVIAVPMDNPSRLEWEFHSSTYRGVCQGAEQYGYDVLNLVRPNPDWALERREVQFLDRRSDGVIFALPDTGESKDTYEMLARNQIPAVVCYRRDVPEGIAWVDPDNQGAMYGAVSHLVAQGHQRIAYLTVDNFHFDISERCRHFIEAMRLHGLPDCTERIVETTFFGVTVEVVERIMATGATAVVCFNDGMALELWRVMDEAGLSVPDDLSLVGVDNERRAKERGLTTMGFSCAEIGRRAMESLVARLGGEAAEKCCSIVPVQLYERSSVRNLTV